MIALLDAASNLGLKRPAPDREPGTRFAPWQLRALGLAARLGARDAGAVPVPAYSGERDADTGVLHAPLLKRCGLDLAEALAPILDAGEVPLVLGGDCSVLPGALLALRRRGRYGLLYIDGHRDLLTPARSQHGAAAGMALALALGHGPESLVSLGGYRPLVDAHDVLVLGHRDLDRWYEPDVLREQREAMQSVDVAGLLEPPLIGERAAPGGDHLVVDGMRGASGQHPRRGAAWVSRMPSSGGRFRCR